MGASRESYNIWWDIKSRNWRKVRSSIGELIFFWKKSYSRSLIVKDTFTTPFNKKFGCKLFGHKWCTEEDIRKYDLDDMYLCWKCFKRETISERKTNNREDKINSILNE